MLKAQNKSEANKFSFKRKTNTSQQQVPPPPTNIVARKKVDDVNTEYIRYVQERKTNKQQIDQEKPEE